MTNAPEEGLRLQVFLARAGVASRRGGEELIRQGAVTVNGELVTRLGSRVDPDRDHVKVNGRLVKGPERKVWLMLHKPRGVVSTASDPEGRPTVLDLVRVKGARLFPVGRLDLQSEGLLLLTNDGEAAQTLLHPRFEVPRTYQAKIRGHLDEAARKRLKAGVVLEGKRTQPLEARGVRKLENASWVEVTVHEGRQHLVRDALAAVGHAVVKLKRTAFGPLKLGRLPAGKSRALSDEELAALRELAGQGPPGRRKRSTRKRGSQRKHSR